MQVNATDSNMFPRSTIYSFGLSVPYLTQNDLLAYFAKLLMGKLDEVDLILPHFKKMEVTNKGLATIWFSEKMVQASSHHIKLGLAVFQITGGDNERQELTNWNVTEVTASYIKLEVKFANPLEISAFGVTNQDKL